jgi:hypothetical protein
MWYSVRITVHYGDGVHSITVSQKTFAEIRGGREITLQGDGFASEEGTVVDYWEFNSDTSTEALVSQIPHAFSESSSAFASFRSSVPKVVGV